MAARTLLIAFSITLFIIMTKTAFIMIPELPVDPLLLFKSQVALTLWENDLNNNYGRRTENPFRTKRHTDLIHAYLNLISKQLSIYDNVVIG